LQSYNNQVIISKEIFNQIFQFQVPKEVVLTECNTKEKEVCTDQWVCLDYPKPASLKQCNNKKWQPTGEDCKKIYVDNCEDVPKTIYV
jgi:hypothetical protein